MLNPEEDSDAETSDGKVRFSVKEKKTFLISIIIFLCSFQVVPTKTC